MDFSNSIPESLPVYDSEAKIVINANPSYWSDPKPEVKTAGDVSGTYRQYNAIVQREARRIDQIDKVKEYLIENYDELEMHADEIAKLLDIELTQYVEFSMEVTITGSIAIPVGKTFDDLSEYDFEVELTCNDSDYEVDNYDVSIDRLREG